MVGGFSLGFGADGGEERRGSGWEGRETGSLVKMGKERMPMLVTEVSTTDTG